MNVLVQRIAVASFDAAEPAPRRFNVPEAITVLDLLRRVRDADFLPSLPGSRATWVVEGNVPLALAMQEYREPWPLLSAETRFVAVAGRLPRPHLLFRHLEGESPESAFRRLGGDPVRLGRDAFKASKEITWAAALRDFFGPGERSR